jgi:uncharacterized protein (TIGR02996 family)
MTVTREDLLRAAYASADDTERLVYADWLEQHGEVERAQVIHLQCEHARTGRFERRRLELEWELDAVFAALGDRWRDGLPVLDGVEWLALERGLPAAVRVRDVATLLANADAIIAAAPTVNRVELQRMEVGDDEASVPWLRTLHVAGAMGANPLFSIPAEIELAVGEYEQLDWITRDRPLERLTVVRNATVGDELAQMLAGAAWAKQLTTLHLPTSRAEQGFSYYDADPRLTADGAEALAGMKSLEVIDIDRHGVGTKPVERLLGLPKLREFSARECAVKKLSLAKSKGDPIEVLDLSKNAIGAAGVQAIAKAPRMRQLQRLELDTCEIEVLGLLELVRSPIWDTLRWLDLSRNPLGIAGARVLVEAPKPQQLHTLLLADADFDDAAGNALGKVAWLGSLAQLDLSGNPLGRGGAALRNLEPEGLGKLTLAAIGMERTEAAAIARFWPRVVHLDLGGNAFGDAGLERFATMKEASALQTLSLRDCKLGDDGLELLAARGRCPRLRGLDLAGNALGAKALEVLLRAPMLRAVTSLDLSRCALDAETVSMIARTPMPPALARLNLRGNELDERQLLALADSTTLPAVAKLELDGNPFVFQASVRERLERRFGAGWYRE